MGCSISVEYKKLLQQKDIVKSSLYSDSYRHLHPNDFSNVQLGLSFAQDESDFEVYLRGSLYKKHEKLNGPESQSVKAHEIFYDSLSEQERIQLRNEHKVVF
jgi:hypothetical protein